MDEVTQVPECGLCGRHGQTLQLYPDRGRKVCEKCLMAGVEDDAQWALENSLVTVRAR